MESVEATSSLVVFAVLAIALLWGKPLKKYWSVQGFSAWSACAGTVVLSAFAGLMAMLLGTIGAISEIVVEIGSPKQVSTQQILSLWCLFSYFCLVTLTSILTIKLSFLVLYFCERRIRRAFRFRLPDCLILARPENRGHSLGGEIRVLCEERIWGFVLATVELYSASEQASSTKFMVITTEPRQEASGVVAGGA